MAVGDDSDSRALLFIYTEHTAANRSLMHDTAWMWMNGERNGGHEVEGEREEYSNVHVY